MALTRKAPGPNGTQVWLVSIGPSEEATEHEEHGAFEASCEAEAIHKGQLHYLGDAGWDPEAKVVIEINGPEIRFFEAHDFNHSTWFSARRVR